MSSENAKPSGVTLETSSGVGCHSSFLFSRRESVTRICCDCENLAQENPNFSIRRHVLVLASVVVVGVVVVRGPSSVVLTRQLLSLELLGERKELCLVACLVLRTSL